MPDGTCSVDGCEKPIRCRNYCALHYEKNRRFGGPLASKKRKTPEERFWEKVAPPDEMGCRRWTGAMYPNGYGAFRPYGNSGEQYAHRFAYELGTGIPPGDSQILHSCDVRCCVNWEHMSLGTTQDNTADMVAKGRQSWGESSGTNKLSAEQVQEIRLLRSQGWTQYQLADRFGVRQPAISKLLRGKSWKRLD